MRKHTFIKAAMLTLAAAIVSSCGKKIEFTYTEVEATKQDVTTTVTATGTIEPVTSVDVGTQVSGIVSKLYVDYNSASTIRRPTTSASRHSMTRASSRPMTTNRPDSPASRRSRP